MTQWSKESHGTDTTTTTANSSFEGGRKDTYRVDQISNTCILHRTPLGVCVCVCVGVLPDTCAVPRPHGIPDHARV